MGVSITFPNLLQQLPTGLAHVPSCLQQVLTGLWRVNTGQKLPSLRQDVQGSYTPTVPRFHPEIPGLGRWPLTSALAGWALRSIESREGTMASRRVEEGLSRSF